jgi:hypothetical protein
VPDENVRAKNRCGGGGTSAVKRENRNCDRSEPWGTPAVILHYDILISAIVALKVLFSGKKSFE